MKSEWERYFNVKTFIVLSILFVSPINLVAQDNSLWNSIDSINIDCANSYFSNKDINTIVGIWEAHDGVIFMIKDCYDKEGVANYQIIMLKDRGYYGDWHIKVPSGNVIGLLCNTADKNIFTCKYRRKERDAINIFHLSLRGQKLVYTGSSTLRRKLFAVKKYPKQESTPSSPIPASPIEKGKIERESSK